MEEKHIALYILGILAIVVLVGLILAYSGAKTGAIASGIYGGALRVDRPPEEEAFPYTRWIDKLEEQPYAYGVQVQQQIPDFGGASRTFGGSLNPGVEIGTSDGFVYNRDPTKRVWQVKTSCAGQVNIGVLPQGFTRAASVQLAQSLGLQNCIKAPEEINNYAFCCKEPGAIRAY
jgi:hypothetical protein